MKMRSHRKSYATDNVERVLRKGASEQVEQRRKELERFEIKKKLKLDEANLDPSTFRLNST